jgi:phosphatidylglycerol:prolipoprotein diacylglycerol transferase
MRQTLCYFPETLFGCPLFGWGWGLGLLLVAAFLSHICQYVRHRKIKDIGSSLALLGIAGVLLVFVVPNLAVPGHGIPIRGYGFCLLVAILAALGLVVHLAKQHDISTEKIFSLCFWAVISGILGARFFFITEYWQETLCFDPSGHLLLRESLFRVLNFAEGGLVVFGSILGGILGSLIFMIRNKMPVLRTFDIMAPAMILGSAIGRIGCLLNGCCFGSVTDVPWAIVFPPGSPAHVHQVAHGDVFHYGLKFGAVTLDGQPMLAVGAVQPHSEAEAMGVKPDMVLRHISCKHEGQSVVWQPQTCREAAALLADLQRTVPDEKVQFDFSVHSETKSYRLLPGSSEVLPVHPTQIYSSILALLLCGTLLFLGRLRFYRQRSGLVFASYMVLYSSGRFLIEILRTDEDFFFGTGLTVSQNVSILFCLTGIALFVFVCRRHPL